MHRMNLMASHRPTSSLCLAASCLSQLPWCSTLQQQNNLLINCVHNFFWSHISFQPPWKCYLPKYQPWPVGLPMTFLCLILCICNLLKIHTVLCQDFSQVQRLLFYQNHPLCWIFHYPKQLQSIFPMFMTLVTSQLQPVRILVTCLHLKFPSSRGTTQRCRNPYKIPINIRWL